MQFNIPYKKNINLCLKIISLYFILFYFIFKFLIYMCIFLIFKLQKKNRRFNVDILKMQLF